MRNPLPRATCPRCHRSVAVRVTGEFREHRPYPEAPWDRITRGLCFGSGSTPSKVEGWGGKVESTDYREQGQ